GAGYWMGRLCQRDRTTEDRGRTTDDRRPILLLLSVRCRPSSVICSLPPRLERLGEGALARRAFFDRQDGAAAVGVDGWDVEPGPFLEQLDVVRGLALARLQADEEEGRRHLHH